MSIEKPTAAANKKIDPNRIAALARSATHGLSRPKTLALWRNFIARFPKEVSYARQYVLELLLTEGWPELDAFEATARRYKSTELDLNYIDAALARLELDSARRRLSQYVRRHGTSLPYLLREYGFNCLAGDFANAEVIARQLKSLRSVDDLPARQLGRRAKFYGQLHERWRPADNPPLDYDIFVINLDSDTLRMERMRKQLGDVPYTRIPGVKGAYLPAYVLRAVSQNQGHLLKGTMGCFLSHIALWEKVAAGTRNALVLEDDASVIAGLPPSLAALRLPDDFDVTFVNERMHPANFRFPAASFRTAETNEVAKTKPANWSSAGTDGYFISPKGARTLLALIERDGIAGDVDWRLVSYSLTRPERTAIIKRGGFAGQSLAYHERFRSSSKRLRCHVLLPALVRQFAGGSVRLWDNELPHAHMAAVQTILAKRR